MRQNLFILSLLNFCLFTLTAAVDKVPEDRLLLIVGAGRSGTQYVTKLLNKAGLSIGQEKMECDGSVNWLWAADSEIYPWGPTKNKYRFAHVFHQVRHPLKVISSWYYNNIMTTQAKLTIYLSKTIPEWVGTDPPLVKCAKYWYYWNLMAGEKAEWRYRVEDLPEIWDEFQSHLGMKLIDEGLSVIPENANHKKDYKVTLTWAQLKQALNPVDFKNIQDLAVEYGYSIEDE